MVEIRTSEEYPEKMELVGKPIIGYQARLINFNVKECTVKDEETGESKKQYSYESVFVNAMEFEYEKIVPIMIKAHYSDNDEFAIQRKAILGDTEEFETYNKWVEYCKNFAKSLFN